MEKRVSVEIKKIDNLIDKKIRNTINIKNISHTQILILKYLYNNKNIDISQSMIEKETLLTRATVSGVLNTMEKNNLITRESSSIDSRKKIVKLTYNSLCNIDIIVGKLKTFEKELKKDITEEELNSFWNVVDKLKNNLMKEGNNI